MNDNEHIHIEFHNKAREIFFSIVQAFESSVKKVNRRKEEYEFQQLKNKYANTLKQELEACAQELMKQHQHAREMNELNLGLQRFIHDYLHLFIQKSRSI